MNTPMTVRIAPDVPVIVLTRALAQAGLCLRDDGNGPVLTFSGSYVRDGETAAGHVPAFLRVVQPAQPTNVVRMPRRHVTDHGPNPAA